MNVEEVRELAARLADDARATPEQKSLANRRLTELRGASPIQADAVLTELEALRDVIERRVPHDRAAASAHDSVRWSTLTSPLYDTEMRWEKRARRQFFLGAMMIPGLVIAIILIAIFMPHEAFTLVLLSELGLLTLAYSYIVFRVHQQTAVAEERMAEKRVGLTFLQIALEQYSRQPEFESLLRQGTHMFLGHHAPETVLLGPEDVLALKQLLTKSKGQLQE